MSITFAEDDVETEIEPEEDEVAVHYDIASYPSDYTLSGLAQMWEDGDIEIPDYQREFVWGIKQSSLLIDSFLTGLPVPPIFFYIDEDNKNLVIDGQQRLLSIVFYMEGYFGKESTHGKRQVFRLSGLGGKSPYDGKKFEELNEADRRKLKQAVLRAINIRQLNPIGESTSAYHIFERLNTGGTPLKPQEIRNCVFQGSFSRVLKDTNMDTNWRLIIGRPNLDKHQKDVELILRIFSLVGASENYEKPMKEFLNKAMKKHQSGITKKVQNFLKIFPIITQLVAEEIGGKPFHLRGPLNVSALDSILAVLIENHKKLSKINFAEKFKILINDKIFLEDATINTTDTKTVQNRVARVKNIFFGI
jgi:uncharacterized protein with ParB-like and HNH nuclease domain